MSDWNVFFSSLAQATAAFVGLLGAFIITKIINNEQKFNENKDRIQDLILNTQNIKRKLDNRYFKWYNERTLENTLDSLANDIKEDNSLLNENFDSLYKQYKFSRFDKKENIKQKIDELKEKWGGYCCER